MSQLTHFQEITIIPEPEIAPYFIWSKLFNQLHIALADIKNEHDIDNIGVSFPDYYYDSKKEQSSKLGLKLRVFAPSQKELETLNLTKWLERLTDYVHIKGIKEVPIDKATGYVSVHRYRFKPADLQADSLANKLGVSYEDAMATVNKRAPEKAVPYIQMRSQTNQSNYRLRVLQLPFDAPKAGNFNTYGMNGMSDHVTVPHW